MNKFLTTAILTVATGTSSAMCMSTGKWNIGAAAGWGSTRTAINERLLYKGTLIDHYKAKVHGNGFTGGVTADYVTSKEKLMWALGVAGYLDAYTARDNSDKKDLNDPTDTIDSRDSLKRNYTLEMATKVGRHLTPDMTAYGKIGGLYSSFKRQYGLAGDGLSGKATTGAWGGVLGAGITKQYTPTVKIGLAYDFHYYESLKLKTGPYSTGHTDLTNLRPKYHQIYLTVSKAI